MSLLSIFGAVKLERDQQEAKWGVQQHFSVIWHLILAEEWGEVSKEMNEVYFRNKPAYGLREELIQTIAVATRMIEEIDK